MDVAKNQEIWGEDTYWAEGGDDWSAPWGDVATQWHGTILPRIHGCLPADTILEIACGFGRWTEYLLRHCRNLIVIDLSERCIAHCRDRFSQYENITYYVNDGRSLDMIARRSIDFIFSFDSLVHADPGAMEAYVSQFPEVLKPEGRAFIHHSNLGEHLKKVPRIGTVPTLKGALAGVGILHRDYHWRDPDVSAEMVRTFSNRHKIRCAAQEIVGWKAKFGLDCFSLLTNDWTPSSGDGTLIRRNRDFMREVSGLRHLFALYHRASGGAEMSAPSGRGRWSAIAAAKAALG